MFLIKTFKALADETRLRITRLLQHGAFHVNEILFVINAKQSNISHHLKILQENGLVINKREGSLIYYTLNKYNENEVSDLITDIITKHEKDINFFQDDKKRLDTIIQKRKDRAENYFSSIGKELDDIQDRLFKHLYRTNEIVEFFGSKMDSILDVGCGTGRSLPILAKYSKKVIGIDSSPSMLQLSEHICKKYKINYELILGDIQKLPLSSNSVNGVFLNMVLHHLSDPFSAIKEISRVIKPKGRLLLTELLPHHNENFREEYAHLWLGFTEEELRTWLRRSNFTVKDTMYKESSKSEKNKDYKAIIILAEKISM